MKFLLCWIATTVAYRVVDDMILKDDDMTTSGYQKWPNGRVPYEVTDQFTVDERKIIIESLNALNDKLKTKVIFIPRENKERDYVNVIKGSGCWSFVGHLGGAQDLSLGAGCVTNGITQHEFIHAVGFLHAHQRIDRDEYVKINSENIIDSATGNFRKEKYDSTYSTQYDYKSVMHYYGNAFSKNGLPTIVALGNYNGDLGNYNQATPTDIMRVLGMYSSPTSPPSSPPTSPPSSPPSYSPECVVGSRGLKRNFINLDNGPVQIMWKPKGRVRISLGKYIGNGRKFDKKNWRGNDLITLRRGRNGKVVQVVAPGVKFKVKTNELVIASLGSNKLRLGDTIIDFTDTTLDVHIAKRPFSTKFCSI